MIEPHATPDLGVGAPVLAFDIGGTDIKSALVDADGALLGLRRTPTPHDSADPAGAVIDAIGALASGLREQHPAIRPEAAGLLAPGIVDADTGTGVFASNIGWRNAPLRDLAARRLDVPVAFDHDVRTASWAELELGGHGYRDVVVIVMGTGISGAVIVDGRPYSANGYAGEIGHSPVADGPACGCGARGCLEAIASGGAVVRRYTAETGVAPGGAREVIALAAAGDPVAARIWDEALDAIALSLAQLTGVLAPQAIILGGGMSRASEELLDPLRARLADRLSFHRMPELLVARLGDDAGILGAALHARALVAHGAPGARVVA